MPTAGWVASASTSGGGDDPAKAIDGDGTTRWSTGVNQAASQWFEVDMQSARTFSVVALDTAVHVNDYPRAYQIKVSNDHTTWNTVAMGLGTTGYLEVIIPVQTARYLQIVQAPDITNEHWSIHELRVYEMTGQERTLLKPVSAWASSEWSTGHASTTIDGSGLAAPTNGGQTQLAQLPKHNEAAFHLAAQMWLGGAVPTPSAPVSIVFDLGSVQLVKTLFVWNCASVGYVTAYNAGISYTGRGVKDVNILASATTTYPVASDFVQTMQFAEANPTPRGFSTNVGGPANEQLDYNTAPGQYDLTVPVMARYIRFEITSTIVAGSWPSLSEVRFATADAPIVARGVSGVAGTGVMITPQSVSASSTYGQLVASATINGAGLAFPTSASVTNPADLPKHNGAHDYPAPAMWLSGVMPSPSAPVSITFDLGSARSFNTLFVWNNAQVTYTNSSSPGIPFTNRGAKDVKVYASTTSSTPASSDYVQSLKLNEARPPIRPSSNTGGAQSQLLDHVSPVEVTHLGRSITARYVRLEISSNHGGNLVGLSEVRFGDVPLQITPVNAWASSALPTRPARATIDGSGMSTWMLSDPATLPKHNEAADYPRPSMWTSNVVPTDQAPVWITYDLGSVQPLDRLYVWNAAEINQVSLSSAGTSETDRGAKDVRIYASTSNPDPGSTDLVKGLQLAKAVPTPQGNSSNVSPSQGQQLDYNTPGATYLLDQPVTARYVKVAINSNWGSTSGVQLSEVRFGYAPAFCSSKADGTACSDADACTQTDTCQGGACVGTNPVTCTASNQCHTAGTCNPATGACSDPAKANDAPCTDTNLCTQVDTCQNGSCVGTNPVTCVASNQCHTAGSCDPTSGACSNPQKVEGTMCDDGNVATQSETCQSGVCQVPTQYPVIRNRVVYDLGAPAAGTASSVQDISNTSYIVGTGSVAGANHAFVWSSATKLKDLDTEPGPSPGGAFNAINDSGVVVGSLARADGSHAFRYSLSGSFLDLGVLGDGSIASDGVEHRGAVALAINNAGQIGGYFTDENAIRGFLFTDGSGVENVGTLEGGQTVINAVSDVGVAYGSSWVSGSPATGIERLGHAVMYASAAGLSDMNLSFNAAQAGWTLITATDAAGDYVAGTGKHDGKLRAFRLNAATGVIDDMWPGWQGDVFGGHVNRRGDYVAWGYVDAANTQRAAFLYSSAVGYKKLNDLTDPAGGWNIDDVSAINDDGDIVGNTLHNGGSVGYLLRSVVAPVRACDGLAENAACADRDECSQASTCHSGVCTGSNPPICPAPGQCQLASVCDPEIGCSFVPKDEGNSCIDGDACTLFDVCLGGTCVGSYAVGCPGTSDCQTGVCNPADGSCSIVNNIDGTPCEDGNPCTFVNTCQSGSCAVGSSSSCAVVGALETMRILEVESAPAEVSYWSALKQQREAQVTYILDPTAAHLATMNSNKTAFELLRNTVQSRRQAADRFAGWLGENANPNASEKIVEAALAVYQFEFHDALGWPRLRNPKFSESCEDIVGGMIFHSLAASIVSDNRAGYAVALQRLEDSVQCGWMHHAMRLEEAMVTAYDKTLARFTPGIRPAAQEVLDSALLNFMLLVHDDTKFQGETKLMAWFRSHRVSLAQKFANPNSVVRLTGLWLRDPSGNRLVQVKKLCEENTAVPTCVSGSHLLDAMIDPMRLGLGLCSAFEMVSAGFKPGLGYDCDRGLCNIPPPQGAGQGYDPAFVSPAMQAAISHGNTSQFGVALSALDARLCNQASRTGEGGAAIGVLGDFGNCILAQNVSPGQAAERCFKKQMRADAFQGPEFNFTGWPADRCGASTSAEGGPKKAPEPPKPPETPEEKKAREDAQARIDAQRKAAEAELTTQVNAAAKQTGLQPTKDNFATIAKIEIKAANYVGAAFHKNDPNGPSVIYIPINQTLLPVTLKEIIKHELAHELISHFPLEGPDLTDDQIEAADHSIFCAPSGVWGLNGCMCDPESGNCNDCSPGSARAHAYTQCLPNLGVTSDPLGSLIYPLESQGGGWGGCFASIDHGLLSKVPLQCMQLQCPDTQTPQVTTGGGCSCSSSNMSGPPPDTRVRNMCNLIQCAPLMPIGMPGWTSVLPEQLAGMDGYIRGENIALPVAGPAACGCSTLAGPIFMSPAL